jgi:hypothetical protein
MAAEAQRKQAARLRKRSESRENKKQKILVEFSPVKRGLVKRYADTGSTAMLALLVPQGHKGTRRSISKATVAAGGRKVSEQQYAAANKQQRSGTAGVVEAKAQRQRIKTSSKFRTNVYVVCVV